MKTIRVIFFSLIFFNVASPAFAQEKNKNEVFFTAQLRPRAEYRDGVFLPLSNNEKPAVLVSGRTRLGVEYISKQKISLGITAQSVNIWGQNPMVQSVETPGSSFQLFEAWGKMEFNKDWALKFGRQTISLVDERIFGALDWAQGARAHDAVALLYKRKKTEFRTYVAYNQNYRRLYGNNINNPSGSLYDVTQAYPYKSLQTIWYKFPVDKNLDISLLASNMSLQNAATPGTKAEVHNLLTAGGNLFYAKNGWKVTGTGYWQHGKNLNAQKVNAYLIAGNLSWKPSTEITLAVGNDFLSGRKNADSSYINNSFQPTLGTNHKFYGSMDYFYAGNGHKDKGLNDTYVKINYNKKETGLALAVHRFISPEKISYSAAKGSNYLATEIDADFNYAFNSFTHLNAGYSLLFASDALSYLKNVTSPLPVQQWVYVSINLNPKILNIKYE